VSYTPAGPARTHRAGVRNRDCRRQDESSPVSRSTRRGLPAAPPTSNRRTSTGLFFKNNHRFLNLGCISTNCRDAVKIVHDPAAETEQTGPRDDRVQSWPHPRVGFDSQRLKGAGPAGCGSDELTDPALLHFNQCARKRPPIEKGSGQVICNSPGHGLVGDANSVGDGSSNGNQTGL